MKDKDKDFRLGKHGTKEQYKGLLDITPRPKIFMALASQSHSWAAGLGEFLDNSLDASAKSIGVIIEGARDTVANIIYIDTGHGMTAEQLNEAMRPGSNTRHKDTDNGMYGVGAKAAGASIANRRIYVSRPKGGDGTVFYAEHYPQTEADYFKLQGLGQASAELTARFEKALATVLPAGKDPKTHHGTMVILSDWRRPLESSSKAVLAEKAITFIRQTYRAAIKGGILFKVNGAAVTGVIDPVMDPKGETLLKKKLRLGGAVVEIEARHLAEDEANVSFDEQGFWVDRGSRQVMAADTLGVYKKHIETARLRIRLTYQAKNDMLFNASNTKSRIVFSDEQVKVLKHHLDPVIKAVKKAAEKAKQKEEDRFSKTHAKKVDKFLSLRLKDLIGELPDFFGPAATAGHGFGPIPRATTKKDPWDVSDRDHNPRNDANQNRPTAPRGMKTLDFENAGKDADMYVTQQTGGFPVIILNNDHPMVRQVRDSAAFQDFFLTLYAEEAAKIRVFSQGTEGVDAATIMQRVRESMSLILGKLYTERKLRK